MKRVVAALCIGIISATSYAGIDFHSSNIYKCYGYSDKKEKINVLINLDEQTIQVRKSIYKIEKIVDETDTSYPGIYSENYLLDNGIYAYLSFLEGKNGKHTIYQRNAVTYNAITYLDLTCREIT